MTKKYIDTKINTNHYRYEKEGWIIVHVEGGPRERGYAYGRLLADDIVNAIEEAKSLMILQTGLGWDFFKEYEDSVLHHWERHLQSPIYSEFYEELQGMVEGVRSKIPEASLDYEDLLLWNGYAELTESWYPTVAEKIYKILPVQDSSQATGRSLKQIHKGTQEHCSAFIATGSYTRDGEIVMAHNSFTTYENANYMNYIVEIVPDRGNSFVMQSYPGYMHSMSDFYETKTGAGQGLMITETTIGGFQAYDEQGAPEFVRIRYATQYAKSLDEFVELFWMNNNGGYANTWLVGDIETGEIMRFEAGLKFYKVDKTKDGYYAGYNAALDPRIRNFECGNSGFADIRRHQGARQVRIPQLLEKHKGMIDNEIAQKILADHYDVYLRKENPCSRTICAHYELDDRAFMSQEGRPAPYQPRGAVDGKTATAEDARRMKLWARWGSSCGKEFRVEEYLKEQPQFEYLRRFLKDREKRAWVEIG